MKTFESEFPADFRKQEIKQILGLTTTGKFCQLVCAPGVGKATILKLLAHNRNLLKYHLGQKEKEVMPIYLNLLDITSFDDVSIAKFLLLNLEQNAPKADGFIELRKWLIQAVNNLKNEDKTVIFLFDHFDQYQNHLPPSFFQILKSLSEVAKYKFSAVFATRRELIDLIDKEIAKAYWSFFVDNAVYMKIFNESANNQLFAQIEKVFAKKLTYAQKAEITKLTGGHAKLTKIITELVHQTNISLDIETLLQNQQVRAVLYELWFYLTSHEQIDLRLLSKNLPITHGEFEPYLTKSNLITHTDKPETKNFEFTIPLFKEFIKTIPQKTDQKITYNPQSREITKGENNISELLSPQEFKLVKYLIDNQNKIIERDEIIKAVWSEAKIADAVSDEAIDQMIFRLRKKIEDEPNNPKHITTIKGRGLKFEP